MSYKGERNAQDEMHGQGTYTWDSGDVYDGEWKEGNMHGQGTYTYANGNVYKGECKRAPSMGKAPTPTPVELSTRVSGRMTITMVLGLSLVPMVQHCGSWLSWASSLMQTENVILLMRTCSARWTSSSNHNPNSSAILECECTISMRLMRFEV